MRENLVNKSQQKILLTSNQYNLRNNFLSKRSFISHRFSQQYPKTIYEVLYRYSQIISDMHVPQLALAQKMIQVQILI